MQCVSSLNNFSDTQVYRVLAIIYLYFTEDSLLRFARGVEFILMVARIDIRNNYIFPLECYSVREGLIFV